MKKPVILIIFLVNILLYICPEYKKDSFAIVLVPDREFLNIYSEPNTNSSIIDKIPAGFKNILVTWKTSNENNNYWLEIKFNKKTGWGDRRFITRYIGPINKNQEKEIEDLLINLTKSLQQKDFDIFKELFYFIRGINIYYQGSKDIIKYDYKELKSLWESITSEDKTGDNNNLKIFSGIQQILESDFAIEYNLNNIKHSMPVEIKNFQFVKLNYNNRTVYIGLEFWINRLYISCICLY